MIEKIITWIKRYFDYKNLPKFIEEEKGTLTNSFNIIILSQAITLLGLALSFMVGSYYGGITLMEVGGVEALFIEVILVIPLFYLFTGLMWGIAKLLGGKGTYRATTYIMSVLAIVGNIISFPITIFFRVESFLYYLMIPSLLLALYAAFVLFHMLKVIHNLSNIRAVATLAVIIFLLTIFFFLPFLFKVS
jgi:hypothetical protein